MTRGQIGRAMMDQGSGRCAGLQAFVSLTAPRERLKERELAVRRLLL